MIRQTPTCRSGPSCVLISRQIAYFANSRYDSVQAFIIKKFQPVGAVQCTCYYKIYMVFHLVLNI